MEYKIVEEFSAPTYYDVETGEKLWESCDESSQGYWVISYNPEEEEIEEWIEVFPTIADAKQYILNKLGEGVQDV